MVVKIEQIVPPTLISFALVKFDKILPFQSELVEVGGEWPNVLPPK